MTTIEHTVSTSEFQQECLNMMHKVSATGIPIVITEDHKPMVKLTRIDDSSQLFEKRSLDSLKGTVSILGDIVNFSTEDEWGIDADEPTVTSKHTVLPTQKSRYGRMKGKMKSSEDIVNFSLAEDGGTDEDNFNDSSTTTIKPKHTNNFGHGCMKGIITTTGDIMRSLAQDCGIDDEDICDSKRHK